MATTKSNAKKSKINTSNKLIKVQLDYKTTVILASTSLNRWLERYPQAKVITV